ncbi:endonuclease/exonuclease/phosphatase family protein [Maribacter sp. 2210JD10-5]|uniref:endonuclease/exonuclease/phosphatase family protein n=1 Tax=Maribacter sp. 2210JD10-5 TaxID=3386272 RepID=UPI0039BD5D4B
MVKHHIYWWNLENLFDIENSPRRSSFLNDKLKSELKDWNINILNQKLDNLVTIISKFNSDNGPDILGVCEVENEFVIEQLIAKMNASLNRAYGFVISESEDKRGIDTALIYDTALYGPDQTTFSLRIIKRNSTRDLFQVHLNTANGNKLILVLNHWPSRSGGELNSEPFRIMVAENLAYWIERIHEEQENPSIVLMGDFNDNPFNRSINEYLMAKNNRALVKSNRVKLRYLYNLMYRFLDAQLGTFVFNSTLNILDQFIVSKTILSEKTEYPFKISTVDIIAYPELVKGTYKKPVRYGRPNASNFNPDGYSDHLPIALVLNEKE